MKLTANQELILAQLPKSLGHRLTFVNQFYADYRGSHFPLSHAEEGLLLYLMWNTELDELALAKFIKRLDKFSCKDILSCINDLKRSA